MMRVAVLDDYQRRAAGYADWDSLGSDVQVEFFHEPIDADDLASRLAGFDVLVLMRERTRFPRGVLSRLPNLRLLITTGMRNASVDADYLRERGIVYCGTQGTSAPTTEGVPSTAEVAWALILAVFKRVTIEDRALREGRWQLGLPRNLAGATLGLAGLGNLGAAMVGPARAFGMNSIAWSEHLTAERAAEAAPARDQAGAARRRRRALHPPRAQRAHPRPVRRRRACADEAHRRHWSTPRAGRSSTRRR